jgi:hypothetical protein
LPKWSHPTHAGVCRTPGKCASKPARDPWIARFALVPKKISVRIDYDDAEAFWGGCQLKVLR